MTIKEIWNNTWMALKPGSEGFSMTKVSAALLITASVVMGFIYATTLTFISVLTIFLTTGVSLLIKRAVELIQEKKINKNPDKDV
jgi:hypothetical protein